MRPGTDVSKTSGWAVACQRSLRCGDMDGFMEALESFFSAIGYDLTDRLLSRLTSAWLLPSCVLSASTWMPR